MISDITRKLLRELLKQPEKLMTDEFIGLLPMKVKVRIALEVMKDFEEWCSKQ